MPELVTELKPCSSTSATQMIRYVTRRYYSIFSGRRQLFARRNFPSRIYNVTKFPGNLIQTWRVKFVTLPHFSYRTQLACHLFPDHPRTNFLLEESDASVLPFHGYHAGRVPNRHQFGTDSAHAVFFHGLTYPMCRFGTNSAPTRHRLAWQLIPDALLGQPPQ